MVNEMGVNITVFKRKYKAEIIIKVNSFFPFRLLVFQYGLWFDSRISFGQYHKSDFVPENGVIRTNLFYDPRDPPNENGTKTDTILSQ